MPLLPNPHRLLAVGLRVEGDGIVHAVERHVLGTVVLPTGQVVGCDPLVPHDEPFTEAVTPGAYPLVAWVAVLADDEYFGYGVDAGTGTLADRTAITALRAWDFEDVDETFIPAQIPRDPVEAVTSAVTDEASGANVFVVGSGWGDGHYPTYLGRAADGRITSFVTDFHVLPEAG